MVADNAPTAPDTEAPTVAIVSPVPCADSVSGNGVAISGTASDNLGASGITLSLSIDEKVTTTVTGGSLRSNWNLRKVAAGSHCLTLTARDAAGNTASTTITVFKELSPLTFDAAAVAGCRSVPLCQVPRNKRRRRRRVTAVPNMPPREPLCVMPMRRIRAQNICPWRYATVT